MRWKDVLTAKETNIKIIVIEDNEDLSKRYYNEIVATCPSDRSILFQVKWPQGKEIIEAIFCEDNVTFTKKHFPVNACSKETDFLRIDSFWRENEDMVGYERQSILLVRKREFYKISVKLLDIY